MDLYIIRHAWAEDRDAGRWPNDDLRPLRDDGRERFADVVKKLRKRGFTPELIGTSPLVRCRQTAEIVANEVDPNPEIVELDALGPGSEIDELMAWTARQSRHHRRIAWVGHAPDVGQLTIEAIGEEIGRVRFPKGAIASIRFDGLPSVGEGELRWLITAKVLGC
jgi:phosphohistidine phosphatase